MPAHIISHLNDMHFQPPNGIADKAKWLEDIKTKYARALYSMDSARSTTKSIDQTLQENQSFPPEERKKLEERKVQLQKQYTEAISFANLVRKQYGGGGGNQRPAQNGAAGPNAANQARPQTAGSQGVTQSGPGLNNGTPVAAPANPMQSSTATVNAAIEAAKKQQLAAGRVPGAVNALPAQQGPPPPQHQSQGPATPAQAQPSPVTQAPPAQPTVSQQQPQQAQQLQHPAPPIKIEPGTQPIPAPLNTAIAAATSMGGMPSAGTPTQNSARLQTPQSATPTTANTNIRPLTHAAAVNLASQRPGGIPAPPTTGPGSNPALGLGVIGAAQQQGHSHAHPPQPQTATLNLQPKLPIAKTLHEKAAQMPTPVPNIGGIGNNTSRPTYSGGGGIGGGVMNQPALNKAPAYQLEGEGERILNKKKLDELVRQVCGGTAEGQEGNLLTPEVEEVRMLHLSSL
jgi:transcription initiation factor TFIID subunit 12